jgi:hypothetical protein
MQGLCKRGMRHKKSRTSGPTGFQQVALGPASDTSITPPDTLHCMRNALDAYTVVFSHIPNQEGEYLWQQNIFL